VRRLGHGSCPKAVNCAGAWTVAKCTKDCGKGNQTKTYAVKTTATNYGTACAVADKAVVKQTCMLKT